MRLLRWLPLLFLASPSVAAEVPVLTLDVTTVELCVSCSPPAVRVPVTARADLKPGDVAVDVVDVGFGSRHDEALRRAVQTATLENSASGAIQAITMTVNADAVKNGALARTGTYDVLLRLQPVKPDSKLPVTSVKLQVVRVPAKLRPPDTLVIERDWHLPPLLGWWLETTKVPLTLLATSDRVALSDVTIVPVGNAAAGNRPVTGHLTAFRGGQAAPPPAPAPTIELNPPERQLRLDYDLVGEFPLGTTTGALEITSLQLADPVPLKFEVRSRLAPWYIFVFIAAGLLVSFMLKTKLQRKIDLAEARLPASTLLERVQAEVARRPDTPFKDALEPARSALTQAVNGSDIAAIKRQTNDLQAALEAAVKEFADRRQRVEARRQALTAITETPWVVPEEIAAAIVAAGGQTVEATRQLMGNDLAHATATLDDATKKLAAALADGLPRWQGDIVAYLDILTAPGRGISAPVKSGLQQAVAQTKPFLGKATVSGPMASTDEMLKAVQALAGELRNAREPLIKLERAQRTEVAEARRILAGLPLPRPAALEQLQTAVAVFTGDLAKSASMPGPALNSLPRGFQDLDAAWQESVLAQAEPAARAGFQTLLDQQQYLEAASEVARMLKARPGGPGTALGPQPAAVPRPTATSWDVDVGFDRGPSPSSVRTVVVEPAPPPLPAAVFASLQAARAWQTLIVGILLAMGGYTLYADKFTGTFADFSLIFFWAFGLDLTVDTVLKVMKKG